MVCKDKTCPICRKGQLSSDARGSYFCDNKDCCLKDCGQAWLKHLMSGAKLYDALEMPILSKARTYFASRPEMIKRLSDRIEDGVLHELDELGIRCSGLGENVTGMMGLANGVRGLKAQLRFVCSDGEKTVSDMACAGKVTQILPTPGCFPMKTERAEPTIYVFPTPVDVLTARSLWDGAGLGDLPAYVFTSFPLPPMFAKTKKIVFVNMSGHLARPEVLASAMEHHRNQVSISARVGPEIADLRTLVVSDYPSLAPRKQEMIPELTPVGKDTDGNTIFFSRQGYYAGKPNMIAPIKISDFAFLPKRQITAATGKYAHATTADLYVDGKLTNTDVVLPENPTWGSDTILRLAKATIQDHSVSWRRIVHGATFGIGPAKKISFPFRPCVSDGAVVFPRFRLTRKGIDPHPEILGFMCKCRSSLDYSGLAPGQASKEDMAELARLFISDQPSHMAATLGLCSWLHAVISELIGEAKNELLPGLCFEAHHEGIETSPSMAFLSMLFSGSCTPCNNICGGARKLKSRSPPVRMLPGLLSADWQAPRNRLMLYRYTGTSGLYDICRSAMAHPLNMHGNMICAVADVEKAPIMSDIHRIRRAVLHILWKYVQNGETLDPISWISEKPEIRMYVRVAKAFDGLGVRLPPATRFDRIRLKEHKIWMGR